MSIFVELEDLKQKVNFIINKFPEWIPLSQKLASEKGYTLDGFRKHCLNNIHPSKFQKFGNQWHLHRDAWFGMI